MVEGRKGVDGWGALDGEVIQGFEVEGKGKTEEGVAGGRGRCLGVARSIQNEARPD